MFLATLLLIPSVFSVPTPSEPGILPLPRLKSSLTPDLHLPGLGWGCPDEKNSMTFWTLKDWKLERVCVCMGRFQFFDSEKRQCSCPPNHSPIYQSGKLTCTPPYLPVKPIQPQSLDIMSLKRKGSARETERYYHHSDQDEANEICGVGERVCKVDGGNVCIDVSNDLTSCGGCPGDSLSVDCGTLIGISSVQCISGICQINSCQKGYTLEEDPYPEAPSNAICVLKQKMPWFGYQSPTLKFDGID
ncbi:uncharacterized protein L203_102683 [Cryptococcus depauperatus CBS 7841]|uniref:Uncharacterized protein n=1 Tax=Cryptococcus depauperatus CBS 7841 TaxID=1295531 RepID=A0A1E3HWF2_9TREE|nr:hypothetical protein L203_05903 [Cryptococcus depauperatus CBS 7841]